MPNRLRRIAPALATVLLALTSVHAASGQADRAKVYRPSEVLARSSALAGKQVVIRGYADISTHSRNIYDSEADFRTRQGGRSRPRCVGLAGTDAQMTRLRRGYETFRGVVLADACKAGDVCLYWCANVVVDIGRGG